MIKIYVQTREKGQISIDINSTSLIEQLKFKIQKKEGTPMMYQCILYRGDYLEDNYSLKHYSIKSYCTVFMFNKKKSLLLKSSNIFNNSSLIDRIRQSCIDIEIDTTEYEAMHLLNEAIFYLDKIFDAKTTKELFTLIFSCFRHFPEQSLDIINKAFHQKMITNNLYLITVSILSFLDENHPEIPIQNFESLILNVRKEILPQIQSSNNNSKLILFDQEVDILFQAELISDVALLSELTQENVLIFYPIILHSNLIHKMNCFIQKVSKANLLNIIPESEFLIDDLFLNLNPENMYNFILIVTEQTFRKILPKIKGKIIQRTKFLPFISNPIIEKCIQYDISMASMTVLLDHFTNYELIMNNLNYLIKYKIQLPGNFVSQIPTFPKSPLLLKIVSNAENLPVEILSFALNEAEDIKSYECAFNSDITSPTLSTLEFWKHILTIVSNLSELEIFSSEKLLMKLAFCLEDNVPLQKFDEFFDHLIFDNFPPNKKQSIFLRLLFEYLQLEYRNVLLEENRNEQRFERFFDYKIVPHYTLYRLFNFDRIVGKYKTYNTYQLYALYLYDSKNLRFTLDEIEFNLKKESFDFIATFIREKNDCDLLTNIDNESTLLFIVHSMIFGSKKFNVGKFKGITKENILPIIAIYFNTLNSKTKLNNISNENYELLIKSCDLLFNDNVPQIYIESINVILLLYFSNCDNIDYSFKLVDTLLNYILVKNKNYKGDANKIITLLFRASSENSDKNIEKKISLIFKKYGISLFKFFLKHKKETIDCPYQINDNDLLFKKVDYRLNLKLLNANQVTKVIVDEIRQQENDELFQTIYFIHNLCSNVPKLQFNDLINVKKTFEQLLNDERWEDLMKFITFSQDYNIKLEDFIKIDDFIKHLLNDSELEKHQILFDILFKSFMKDSYFATKYATYILERCTINITIKPSSFLEKASYIYYEYKDIFDRVFDEMYAFFPKANIYDYRVLIVKKLYIPKDYSVPRIDCSFIKKLIEENSYQSFLCLHKIASYFPFLFEKQFYQVINAVLPSLDYLHLLFDESKKENAKNIKIFYSAFSFLMSCLYSSEFLSDFCYWVFENLTKLSNDQVLCMSSILYLLFDKNRVRRPVLSLAYKYNFLDIIVNLLNRKIEDGQFRKNYLISLSKLAESYVNFFCNVSKFATYIFFDMVKKESIKNPFQLEFDNLSATPFDGFSIYNLLIPTLYEELFFSKINEKYRFMINSSFTRYPTNEELLKFLNNFKNKEVEYVKTKEKTIPYLLTVKMVSYLCSQPSWVFSYFCDHYALAKLPEHFIFLDQIATTLIRMSHKKNKNDELSPTDFNPTEYFTSEICHDSFHKFLLNEIETNNEIDDYVYDVISSLVKNEKNMISFLNYICDSLVLVESNLSSRIFSRLTNVINYIIISNTEMSQYFFVICGNKLIHIALSPFFRFNESIMLDLVNTLCLLGKDLPIRTIQIIGFISTLHPNLMTNAMALYEKLSKDKAKVAFNLIKNTFENEKQKEEPNFYMIKCFIEKDPSMMKNEIPFLFKLVPIYITRFINEDYTNNDLFDTICILFDFLAPKRDNDSKSNYYSIKIDEVESTNHLFPPSNNLIQTSKDFWVNIYDKNRSFLNKMIEKDEEVFDNLNFLLEFHELVSFPIRLSYFRRKAKEMENEHCIYFNVKRSNIIQDTFEAFSKYETYDLLSSFNVNFVGEYGVDAGGLTREWFSCLIKELFNPDFGLFIKSGKESYFPNSMSYINTNHIDFFKFAGKIIGLALIKNQYVNAHLSFALLKQILHQDVVFKDLEDYDDSLMKSLQMILDAADVKNFDLYFQIDDNQFGKVISTNLIKNGSKIQVTNQNRNDYVNLYADYKLRKSVIKQITAFCDGFDEIVPPKLIQLFSPSELNLMICGIPKIDINDMKMFTQYSPPYNKNHSVIQMFFKMLTKWSHENLAKLLLFITGSSQVPVNGFRDFFDRGNPICISPGGEKDRLPVAHTCSNMLCLPYYDNENDMNNKLLMAIQHCEFGMA